MTYLFFHSGNQVTLIFTEYTHWILSFERSPGTCRCIVYTLWELFLTLFLWRCVIFVRSKCLVERLRDMEHKTTNRSIEHLWQVKKLKEFITLGGEVSRQASKFMEGCTHVQFEIIILKFILKRGVFLYFKPTRENWATQFYMGLSQLCVYIHYYRKFITAGSRPPSPTVLAPVGKSHWWWLVSITAGSEPSVVFYTPTRLGT